MGGRLIGEMEAIFRAASELEDPNVFDDKYSELIDQGVRLHDVENSIEIKYFAIHIDGDKVHLRYAETPYHE